MRYQPKIVAIAAALLSTAVLVPVSLAADDTNVTVTGGSLSITADPTAGNFTGVTLNGSAQTTTATLSAFDVVDSRGTGAGWNVNITATQFKEYADGAYVSSGKTLPAGSMSLAALVASPSGPTSTAGTIDVSGGRKVASAAADAGMGTTTFAASTLTLTVPSTAYAKTYRSDATITLATGP